MKVVVNNLPLRKSFDTGTFTFLLKVSKKFINLESYKEYSIKEKLNEKSEFHFTIIGSKTGKSIIDRLNKFDNPKRNKMTNNLMELVNKYNWNVKFINSYYFIEKTYKLLDEIEYRKSIIQLAEISDLNDFYLELNKLFEMNFKIPFPHITLYTNSNLDKNRLRGIGVYSINEFNELMPIQI